MKRCPERRRGYYDDGDKTRSSCSFRFLVLLLTATALSLSAQPAQQHPSPMTDTTRPHPRIAQVETPGRRIELKALRGAVLFAGPKVKVDKPVPLLVHFHGAPWLAQYHAAQRLPRAALITVQLGAGSAAYGRPFEDPEIFRAIIDEAKAELGLKHGWSSITLTGFSAGYGAVRAILRQETNFTRVDNVLLLDGIHAGYSPEGKLAADGGTVNAADLDSFVAFAREAAAGKRSFVITHSEIFPGTYASTTECVDHLLGALGIKRKSRLKTGPIGMQQLSVADAKGLHIRGYAGNTAQDHVDHLHAMFEWFKLLDVE
jgi:hypothetical protein